MEHADLVKNIIEDLCYIYNLYEIYHMQCILYIPDAMQSVSTIFSTNCVYPYGCIAGEMDYSVVGYGPIFKCIIHSLCHLHLF